MINLDREFSICPYRNGIKINRPDQLKKPDYYLDKLPIHVVLLNDLSEIQYINESTVINCGFNSIKETLGKTVKAAAKNKTADFSINHDRKVIYEKKLVILEEDYTKNNGENFHALTIKVPWYNDDKVAGVFGFSIVLGKHNLAESLNFIINTGIIDSKKLALPSYEIPFNNINVIFSSREKQCIELLVKGNTTKMIAKSLNLSPRTVEHYIENIKIKLNVNNKYEIINRFI